MVEQFGLSGRQCVRAYRETLKTEVSFCTSSNTLLTLVKMMPLVSTELNVNEASVELIYVSPQYASFKLICQHQISRASSF
jgi:hypothetical protein